MQNKFIALIPAREGSKRFPHKNTALLNGKPLISWTIETALNSKCFHEVIVSTDDHTVLNIAREYHKVTLHYREPKLATDNATVTEVLLDLLINRENNKISDDAFTILLPTVPFRKGIHIQDALNLLTDSIDAVVSVTPFELPPQFALTFDASTRFLYPKETDSPLIKGRTRQQQQQTLYHPNGAIYTAWKESIKKQRSFFKGRVKGYIMDRISSVDIDTELDLEWARFLIERFK